MSRWLLRSRISLVLALGVGALRLSAQVIPPGTYTTVINGDTIASGIVYADPGSSFASSTLTLANNTGIYWRQVGSLDGIAITSGTGAYLYVSGANNALTLGATTTVTGAVRIYTDGSAGTTINNQGTLTHTGGTGQLYAINLANSGAVTATGGTFYFGYPAAGFVAANTGTVTADGSSTTVYIRGAVANTGTMTAQNNGTLFWDGDTTTANLGSVVLTGGGRARLNGTLDNTAANLTAPSGGSFQLYGGIITGGTIANDALTFTSSGGYLDGASLTGDLFLDSGAYVRFKNGADFTGPNATFANNGGVYWQQTGTLSGKTITQGSGSYFYLSGAGAAVTLDATSAVTGSVRFYTDGSAGTTILNQGTMTNTFGVGQIYASNFTNEGTITATEGTLYLNYPSASYNATNLGAVISDGSAATIYLRGNFDNNGTLTAQNNGTLFWDGNTTTAHLGNVVLTGGGRALLNGTLDNTAATLTAPTGGRYQLYGGTISGGTIDSDALAFTSAGGYLSDVTFTGDFTMAAPGTYVRFTNGATITGTNLSLADSSGIYWQQVGTLAGKAITQGAGSYLYLSGAGTSLAFDAGTAVTGSVRVYTDGSANSTILNQGTMTNTSGTGQVYATGFTNEGAISATAGTLYLGYPSAGYDTTNTGTVTADGGGTTVYLRGNFDNDGTLTAQNGGTLRWDGANTTANLGNVVLSGGSAVLNGTLDNTAATLTAPTGGRFQLLGGTITGGTIANDALTFTTSGGYLTGATITGDLSFTTSGSYVRFLSGSTFSGSNLNLAGNNGIYWQQVGALTGKTITQGAAAYLYVVGANNSLTLDAATSVTGTVSLYSDGSAGTAITNQGTLNHTGGSGQNYASNYTNAGTILATGGTLYLGYPSASYNTTNTGTVTADGSGTTVYLRGNFDNNGTLTAQNNGVLLWDGINTDSNLGNVVLTGNGRARLNGTINNSGTITAPTGGAFELYGGTITGGTVAANALSFTTSGGYLTGVTVADDLILNTANSYVRFLSGTMFTGANLTLGSGAGLYWQQVGTLAGKTITQASGSYVYVAGANSSLTLDAATTLTGTVSLYSDGNAGTTIVNQGTLHHTSGTGSNYAENFTNAGTLSATGGTLYLGYPSSSYHATNTGTVTADGSGTTVYLRGDFDNNGTVTAQNNGTLIWDGGIPSANLGNVTLASGGRARLTGTVDNNAATLNAPTGGSFELAGAIIQGGTVADGALSFTSSSGYLTGVTLAGDLNLSATGSTVRFLSGTDFTGSNANFGPNSSLYWQQVGTMVERLITMSPGSYLYVSGVGNTLTLDPNTVVNGTVEIFTDSSSGVGFTNQGTINHTSGTGYLDGKTFTNSGTVNISAGSFYLGDSGSFNTINTSTGVIQQTGGTVYVYAPLSNSGTLKVSGGTLYTNGYLTNTATGRIGGSGTIVGDLSLGGGTIAPGNSIGTLTINASDFVVSGPAVFEVELDAFNSDRLTFINPTSNVDIGAGLLTLSLNLLSAPGEGTTYTLMNISGGSYAITGTFAGLPNSGDALIANFEGTDYILNVVYLNNAILLQVPEPSTYALLGAGLALLALRRRKRSA